MSGAAGGCDNADLGVALMRKAFKEEGGPLTDQQAEPAEKQAASNLFAGVIGLYKNAVSHRDLNLSDPRTAAEIIVIASHLLRIVDERIALNGGDGLNGYS